MWQDVKLLNATANVLFGVCALLLFLAALWSLMNRPLFNLNVIQIEGGGDVVLKHVNSQIIRSIAVTKITGNFFTANLDSVRRAFEMVPWVRRASVRREWPDRLIVTLEEHLPLGTWGEDGQILSVKGDVFTANLAEVEEESMLLEFSGPPGSEKEVLAHYLQFKDWFNAISLEPESVNYSKRYAWLVKLNNGLSVELGREENGAMLQERVARLIEVYPELTSRLQGKIESVDLRYPNGLALKAKGQELNVVTKTKK
ncbi:cell division protein FtsQ [Oxalobacteraceae bacterium GrIS 2.11]